MRPVIYNGDAIDANWHWLGPMLGKAIKRNVDGFTIDHVREAVDYGDNFVLCIFDNDRPVMASFVEVLPDAVHCRLFAGEDMRSWIDLYMDTLKLIGKNLGKHYMTSFSRPGMKKALKKWAGVHSLYLVGEI